MALSVSPASPRIGIVVVCSPARSHPSTELIDSVLSSLDLFEGLSDAPVGVVCDGCRELEPDHAARLSAKLEANPMRFSKRGIVSQRVAASYALYKQRLADGGRPRAVSTLELDSHHGFALSVREGLRWVQEAGCTHALVCQHDRRFLRRVAAPTISALLAHFDQTPSCRRPQPQPYKPNPHPHPHPTPSQVHRLPFGHVQAPRGTHRERVPARRTARYLPNP